MTAARTRPRWLARLGAVLAAQILATAPAAAETLRLPAAGDSLVGELRMVHTGAEDTLLDIAYRHGYGYEEIKLANPDYDPWLPGEQAAIVLPGRHLLPEGPRQGIVINIPEMRLYYYPEPGRGRPAEVMVFPIGIGKQGWLTPETETRVVAKLTRPAWQVPDSIKREREAQGEPLPDVVPPGADNPLGEYALQLALPDYLIHGSNKKYGVGMRVSHGCVRLYPDDIRQLFQRVPEATPVRIVNQPYKVGWQAGVLYLEAHPPLVELAQEAGVTTMVAEVIRATRDTDHDIDWDTAIEAIRQPRGVPVPIGSRVEK
jgi:L,D-transpeptidase ErfK/SrfK